MYSIYCVSQTIILPYYRAMHKKEKNYKRTNELFFVFSDWTLVTSDQFRKVLRKSLSRAKLDYK